MAAKRSRESLVWGIVLLVVGTIFLLETLDIDAWDTAWRFWPVILIVWGAFKLYYGIQERNARAGVRPAAADRDHES